MIKLISKKKFAISLFVILWAFTQRHSLAKENKYPFRNIDEKQEISEFIKLHQRAIIGNPDLEKTKMARFAIGEYYFKHTDLFDTRNVFRKYTNDYPAQISTLIAKAFLLKIAKLHNDIEYAEILKKEIFDKPFVILFSNYKTLKYTSAFGNNYTVHYYINKVEVFLNGELFEKIEP